MAAPITLAPSASFDLDINYARRTLRPRGEIDATTAPKLLDAAKAFMSAAAGDLIIDLARVTFADSSLLHAVMDIRTELRVQGASLWLVNEPPQVVRLFQRSGVVMASGTGSEALYAIQPAGQPDVRSVSGADGSCEIGDAIAILMARYPISYTKAFAAMLASGDRTQRSLPEMANAIIASHSRNPRRAARRRARKRPTALTRDGLGCVSQPGNPVTSLIDWSASPEQACGDRRSLMHAGDRRFGSP